ncbi:ABC transporter transmembrane domain-containing protein [Sediminicoccus sp. KRV36]|uniref:ABC transporter transmembrane domain-containing protein n=1 Tax=Sediminicoccus sp. KRV36 TaxID=3133721 RepID=UPI00200E545B|nr:ABC transporter transmembrane domain-containing protein [Sediminicoccus rosea]UPY37015.1 hypothetical protein LHU95_22820 [Sediminicoccus rosea]
MNDRSQARPDPRFCLRERSTHARLGSIVVEIHVTAGFRTGWMLLISVASNLLALILPLALLQVYDRILPAAEYGTALSLFILVGVAILLDGVLRLARARAVARASILADYRENMGLAHALLASEPLRLATTDKSARRAAFDAVSRARAASGPAARLPLFDLPFAAIFLALVWFIGGQLVLLPLLILALFALLAAGLARHHRAVGIRRAAAEQAVRGRMEDALDGLLDGKGFGLAGRLMQRLDAAMLDHARETERAERGESLLTDGIQLAALTATLAITLAGALLVLRGEMTTGGLAACSLLGGRAVSAGLGAFGSLARRSIAKASVSQLDGFRRALTLPEQAGAAPLALDPGIALVMRDVLVRAAAHTPISHILAEGRIARVTGGDAALRQDVLLAAGGFQAVAAGSLVRAGAAIFVPEQPELFDGTVLDNLTGWDPGRTAQARGLAVALGLAALLDAQPDGLQAPIGSMLLSGMSEGVAKRVALIRALASDAPLLLLHHPEFGLDIEGRQRLARVLGAARQAILLVTDDPMLIPLAGETIPLTETRGLDRMAA